MQLLPFGDYRPDITDIFGNHTRTISNVIPRADGYGPVPGLTAYTAALPEDCRGAFRALTSAGGSVIFAGTASKLYRMNNTNQTWANVSKTSGSYSYSVPSDQIWQFAQYNNFVIAVQGGDPPQVYELDVDTHFADLGGSPPTAKYINIVGEFIVLSGLISFPYRIQWSGRSAPTTWTSGVTESDFQDFGDGGLVQTIGGGEGSTLVMQQYAMRRMVYQPGNPVIFSFERISEDIGIEAPYSLVKSGRRVFFFSNSGFQMSIDGNVPVPIGKEIVDSTFAGEWDDNFLNLTIGFPDPAGTRVFWHYKTLDSDDTDRFDKMLCYDWALEKWSPITGISGQLGQALSQAAITLESLDDIVFVTDSGDTTTGSAIVTNLTDTSSMYAGMSVEGTGIPASTTILSVDSATQITLSANATATNTGVAMTFAGSLDSITASSLDAFPVAFGKEIAIFTNDNKMGFLVGPNLEVTLETPEQGEAGQQMLISGAHPVTDANTVRACCTYRQRINATRARLTNTAMNNEGFVPLRIETRYSRFCVNIPAAAVWTYASGVVPVIRKTGNR